MNKVLNDAASLLETVGWCQRQMIKYNPDTHQPQSYCALGAIEHAGLWQGDYADARKALFQYVRGIGYSSVSGWNDEPGRTKQEVINTLRELAR